MSGDGQHVNHAAQLGAVMSSMGVTGGGEAGIPKSSVEVGIMNIFSTDKELNFRIHKGGVTSVGGGM